MKKKHLFSLLDQSYTTVKVTFSQDEFLLTKGQYDRDKLVKSTYTYKVPLSWCVEEGDMLLVKTKHTLKTVTVVSVDDAPDIDIDAEFDYVWAAQKVDLTEYKSLTEREKEFSKQMIEIERVKQREELIESFRTSLPDGSAARILFEQTTASLSPPPPPPFQAAPGTTDETVDGEGE